MASFTSISCGTRLVVALATVLLPALIAVLLLNILFRKKCIFPNHNKQLKLPPGPPGWPLLGNWLSFRTGITPRSLAALTAKYGDVCMLRMGWSTTIVVVSSPESARQVLAASGQDFASRSRNFVIEFTSGGGQDIVFADYGPHWRLMRRICAAPFFSKSTVQRCSRDYWEEEIDLAVRDLAAVHSSPNPATGKPDPSTVIHPRGRIQLAIYNTLYLLTFNRPFESLEDPLYRQIARANMDNGILGQSFHFNVADFFPPLRPFFWRFMRKVREANQRRHALLRDIFLREYIAQRSKENKNKAGVDFLLDAHESGQITLKNVLYLLQNLNVGALGTTTAMTKWAITELVNNPKVQEKLYEELVDVLGKEAIIKESDITNLPYLQAVVKETLRKHMTIYMLVPHKNDHDAKLMGYDIPAKSRILVNAWGMAHDARYWDQPELFLPERFLVEKIEPFGSDFRFLPFGSGRRSCPGSMMAFVTLALIVAKLTQAFQMFPPPGVPKISTKDFMGQLNYFMAQRLSITIKPRQ